MPVNSLITINKQPNDYYVVNDNGSLELTWIVTTPSPTTYSISFGKIKSGFECSLINVQNNNWASIRKYVPFKSYSSNDPITVEIMQYFDTNSVGTRYDPTVQKFVSVEIDQNCLVVQFMAFDGSGDIKIIQNVIEVKPGGVVNNAVGKAESFDLPINFTFTILTLLTMAIIINRRMYNA